MIYVDWYDLTLFEMEGLLDKTDGFVDGDRKQIVIRQNKEVKYSGKEIK